VIVAIGVDLVDLRRIERLLAGKGERALARLFTPAERAYAMKRPHPVVHLAARIAAKEATYKALRGTPAARAIGWRDLEVVLADDGSPSMVLHGGAEKRAAELGVTRVHLSLTHSASSAAAFVVLEANGATSASE
jgi:holo-[acyl-carrier protein] synthase